MRFTRLAKAPSITPRPLALLAISVLLLSQQLTATALPTPPPVEVERISVHAGFDDFDDFMADQSYFRFTQELARFRDQSAGELLDMELLRDHLMRGFASVDLSDPEIEYVIVEINGEWVRLCRIEQDLTVADPTLSRIVTVQQAIDTVL